MPTLVINKQANFDYRLLDKLSAGIILSGAEVKSIKQKRVNLKGSYVTVNKQLIPQLINAHIAPYPPAGREQKNYQPTRTRQLLLTKKEINKLIGQVNQFGLTIIPIKLYTKGGLIKLEIALAKRRKKFDKRAVIKKRDIDTQLR